MTIRHDSARKLGIKDQYFGKRDRRWNDAVARQAEEWAAAWLGVEPNPLTEGPDDGWDFIFRGHTVDVKWTPHVPTMRRFGDKCWPVYPHLIVPAWKAVRADIYLLVLGPVMEDFDKYTWADGWLWRSEVLEVQPTTWDKQTAARQVYAHRIGFDYLHGLGELLEP